MRCLIVKPSSLGDILHTFPAVKRLAEGLPGCRFDWLAAPNFSGILEYSPVPLERRIPFRRRELGSWRIFSELWRLGRELKSGGKYDLIVDFQGLFRSAFCGRLAPGRRYAGFAEPREFAAAFFYGEKFSVPRNLHAVERNWRLAGMVLGEPDRPTELPALPVSASNAAGAEVLLKSVGILPGTPFVALFPGARWASKRFPPELFAGIAEALLPYRCVLLGAPSETEIAAAAARLSPAADLCGRTSVGELMEILRLAGAAVCNDSGAMHMAAALGTPVAGLYGPTDPERTGAYGAANGRFSADGLDCLGCLKRVCPSPGPGAEPRCHAVDAARIAGWIKNIME